MQKNGATALTRKLSRVSSKVIITQDELSVQFSLTSNLGFHVLPTVPYTHVYCHFCTLNPNNSCLHHYFTGDQNFCIPLGNHIYGRACIVKSESVKSSHFVITLYCSLKNKDLGHLWLGSQVSSGCVVLGNGLLTSNHKSWHLQISYA